MSVGTNVNNTNDGAEILRPKQPVLSISAVDLWECRIVNLPSKQSTECSGSVLVSCVEIK